MKFVTVLALALLAASPALAATRPAGILMHFADARGAVRPALFSLPGHDMPMSECRRALPEQAGVLRASLRSDRDYFGLTYLDAKCVYLDTDPLGRGH